MGGSSKRIVVVSERKVKQDGKTVYHDTIERQPGEVIQLFNPHQVKNKTKHIKLQNNLNQKEQMMALKPDERLLLFCLSYYLEWETNIIVGDGVIGKRNYPLRAADIDILCSIDRHRRQKALRGLIEQNIIAYVVTEERRKAYVMNPQWALNGRNPQEGLLNTFNIKNDVDFIQEQVQIRPIPD